MKRNLLLVLSVIMLLVAGVMAGIVKNRTNVPKIVIKLEGQPSKVKIGRMVMEQYLDYFKDKRSSLKGWIKEYQINEIRSDGYFPNDKNLFTISSVYAVKPYFRIGKQYWESKNGVEDQEGWIRSKTITVIISGENNEYRLVNMVAD